jgi:beta-glucanase (GH16 family)
LRAFSLVILTVLGHLIGAQSISDDFESNGNVALWVGDDCNINTSLSNPWVGPDNPSATVMEYHDVGGLYANVRFDHSNNLALALHSVFQLKVYVPSNGITGNQSNQISLKLQDGNLAQPWTTQCEIIKPILLDRWQTISFDFSNDPYINLNPNSLPPTQRTDFNRVLIQVNGENNTDHVLAYLDDFIYLDTTYGAAGSNYTQLVWADEFNGSGMIDTSKWFHQTILPNGNSWYNGEIQHYTDRIANSTVSNGSLKIIAQKEVFTDQGVTKNYTSARLNSKYAFTYGRVDIRAKLPRGVGTWPAMWLLGQNIDEKGAYWEQKGFGTTPWPACGEIDILEHWGFNPNFVQSAVHSPSSFGATVNKGGRLVSGVLDSFHLYSLVWTPTKLVFSVDGLIHYVYEPAVRDASTWPFDDPQYFILNIAMEASVHPAWQRDTLEIDYLRVYQDPATSLPPVPKQAALSIYPNPVEDQLQIELPASLKGGSLELMIFAIDGRALKRMSPQATNGSLKIGGLDGLKPGLYLLKISGKKGEEFHGNFLVK